MADKWFEWERESTILPLLLCLEAWAHKTKEYCGMSWPTAYLHYKGNVVHWIDPMDELEEFGEYLLDRYIESKAQKELEEEIGKISARLDNFMIKFEQIKLEKLSDTQIIQQYEEIRTNYQTWFAPGAFVEPIGIIGEKIIRNALINRKIELNEIDNILYTITATTKKTFSKKELEDLIEIGILKQEGQSLEKIHSAIKNHAKKYFWLHNNYHTTETLSEQFFENQLEIFASKNQDIRQYLKQKNEEFELIFIRKKQLIKKLQFDQKEIKLIELLELFAYYQDYRKEYVMKLLGCLDAVLYEIGRRNNLSLRLMKSLLPSEVKEIFGSKIEASTLEQRNNEFLAIWEPAKNQLQYFTFNAAEMWKNFNPKMNHKEHAIEIEGLPASGGIIRGKAKVTMNANEAARIEPGQILITSMTTPDFTTAMKKAGAIVTNEGGILCHAAVISREFRIPCVVGTKIATKAIVDGDIIEVDGNRGIVRKV